MAAQKAHVRTSDAIAESLIGDILNGAIHDDSPLPTERELCERFDASRPTIREALSLMHMRGFVHSEAGKRPRAARPTLADVLSDAGQHLRDVLGDAETGAHIEQMRQFIETGAAREAALRSRQVQIAKMQVALSRNYDAIGTDAFAETDVAFHRALVSVIDNPIILALHDMFVSGLLKAVPPVSDKTARDKRSYEEHKMVYEAIVDGDALTATEVMDRHLARSYRARLDPPKSVTDGRNQETT